MTSSIITKTNPSPASAADEEDLDIGRYIDVLISNKWLIAAITLVVFVIGASYAFLERRSTSPTW